MKKTPKSKVGKRAKSRSAWLEENALTKVQLIETLQQQKVTGFEITENEDKEFWLGVCEKRKSTMKHLTTRRNQTTPRMFKRLDVIKRFLREEVGLEGQWTLKLNIKVNGLSNK